MLKIQIVAIGKDKDAWVSEGIEHYTKLLGRYCRMTILSLPSPKQSKALSPLEIKRLEADRLRPYLEEGMSIALSDRGKQHDSHTFAKFLSTLQTKSGGQVTILIGGPYGLDDSILDKATHRLSLSPLTFSHQVVRLVLLEQLYRGFSILHNTDYHK